MRTTNGALVRQFHSKGSLFSYCHLHWPVCLCVYMLKFFEIGTHSHCQLRLALNMQHSTSLGLLSAGIIDLSHHSPVLFYKDVYPGSSTFRQCMKVKVCMDREKICMSQLSICLAVSAMAVPF